MALMEGVKHLQISLEQIKLATRNFNKENIIARGGFGRVYIGELSLSGQKSIVAVKRLDPSCGQGEHEFLTEIYMLSSNRHANLISLVGFCDESKEKILVYEHMRHGSLEKYLSGSELSWIQRLRISIGAARGIRYLHNDVGSEHRILHRDIKSSNILLDENWEAKVSDFGLSKIGLSNTDHTFVVTGLCGTMGYVDPKYVETGILTKESDVYSFGVVLFEILCGRLASIDISLAKLVQRYCKEDRLDEIILPSLKSQMKVDSLDMFVEIAYRCLLKKRKDRPTMDCIVENLEKALELQTGSKATGLIRVWTWGRPNGDPQNHWSFKLEKDHYLLKIAIGHGDAVSSLMFTSETRGFLRTSKSVGSLAVGDGISEVTLDDDEEITGINGTIGTRDGIQIISSLTFETTKRTHGPFGPPTDTVFFVPWNKGSLIGFYGYSSDCIDSIGVYLKAFKEVIRVGTWGRQTGLLGNSWSFRLESNHRLKMITIDHGNQINSLMFTTEYRGSTYTSNWTGHSYHDAFTEVTFEWNEKINAINGTVAVSDRYYAGWTIITSLSFLTNKRTHGPFGHARGTPFTVSWGDSSLVGLYGLAGGFVDSIGVCLKSNVLHLTTND